MKEKRIGDILHHVRQLVRPEQGAGLGDGELLHRWVTRRDEAAFEVLLWRHGSMVLGVCGRVLRDAHEAEDALQATFLALARKASSIGRREAVAGWLYRVAYRVALEARSRAARRPVLNGEYLASVAVEPGDDLSWRDLRPILDEEVNRLPMKYRVPFILHHLEGRTNEDVARELGCPVGTVLSRVARAREQLRSRLLRRGVFLSAGALAASLAASARSATVLPGLIGALVQAAAIVATGAMPPANLVSANAVTLAEGVIKGMAITKLKVVVLLVLALSLLGTSSAVLAHRFVIGPAAVSASRENQQATVQDLGEKAKQPGLAQPKKAAEVRPGEARPGEVDPAIADEARRAEEHARQLREARERLEVAQEKLVVMEEKFTVMLVERRQELTREEERLRALEREQAVERDRERERLRAADEAVRTADPQRDLLRKQEQLAGLEARIKKQESDRTEQVIVARQKVMAAEERLRRLERDQGMQLELAQARVRLATERVLQWEEDQPPTDPQLRTLRDLERKVDSLLREIGELRRAVEKQQPAKGRPSER